MQTITQTHELLIIVKQQLSVIDIGQVKTTSEINFIQIQMK